MTVASARRARALHEALVVILLLIALFGLFLPCVRCLREAAGQASCRDNLRRLAAACFQAENVHGHMPAGVCGGRGTGLLVELLPHLGRADLAGRLPSEGSWYQAAVEPPAAYAVAATRVPLFECPSATGPRASCTVVTAAFGHDDAGAPTCARTVENYRHAESYRPLAVAHYAGVGGAGAGPHPVAAKYAGAFAGTTGIALADVAAGDGLSVTLLLGEACGQREFDSGHPPGECDATWVGVGALPTVRGLGQGLDSDWRQFGSSHGGIVYFALCDGSVRGLRVGRTRLRPPGAVPWSAFDAGSTDWRLLQALAGYRDGTAFDPALCVD